MSNFLLFIGFYFWERCRGDLQVDSVGWLGEPLALILLPHVIGM